MPSAEIQRLDREDPLAGFRERFVLPEGVIYLDGNSLGALPAATARAVARTVEEAWGRDLISSWNTAGWVDLAGRIAADIAVVIGAEAHEVAVGDSISVNLVKLLGAAIGLRPERCTILADRRNFPTDLYVAQGFSALMGDRVRLRLVDSVDDFEPALDRDVALVMASHVDYRSARLTDLDHLVAAAHRVGALVLADLAHSAGVVPVGLSQRGVDLAVGCGYKFLNGGPGAPAFLYVAERHQEAARNPIAGWFGHAAPFEFATEYRPAPGITRFQAGTPPILSLVALAEGVRIAAEAPIDLVRAKAISLTQLFLKRFEADLDGHGFTLASPRDPQERGAQLAFRHPEGYAIVQAAIAGGVVGDFRAPDLVRFGFAPLYLRHADVVEAVARLANIMREGTWRRPEFRTRQKVT